MVDAGWGLVTSAFINQWEVRMKRGAKYGEVMKIVDYNSEEMKWGDSNNGMSEQHRGVGENDREHLEKFD